MSAVVIRSKNCPASITPPKIIAVIISQTVFSIPAIPLDVNSESTIGSPVSGDTVPYIARLTTR